MIHPLRLFSKTTLLTGSFQLFCLGMAAVQPAHAQYSIDTISTWNGTLFVSSFGVPNTATYGQVITVGANTTPLTSFTFEIGNCEVPATFRGEVYAWNGTRATGSSLFESSPVTISGAAGFQPVTFSVANISLSAGQYVLFASTSKDQAGAPTNSVCQSGAVPLSAYSGGQFVFLNNGANSAAWTGQAWILSTPRALAFRVTGLDAIVAPPPPAATGAPASSTISMILCGFALTGLAAYTLTRAGQHS